MKSKITSKLNIVLLILISFLVMFFTLKDNFAGIIHTIVNINIGWLILSIILVIFYWYFRSMSYHTIIKKFDKDYKFKRSLGLMMLTQFFNGITPFASGGQPLVVYTLKKDGISGADGTNIVVADFITYQIALIILGTMAVLYNQFFNIFKETYLLKELVTLGFVVNILVVLGLFLVSFARKFNHFAVKLVIKLLNKLKLVKYKEKALDNWSKKVNTFHDGANLLFRDKKFFLSLIGINMLALISAYTIPLILLFSFGNYHSFGIVIAIVASAYINLVGSFVPIPGGTGGLEFAFIAFFANFIGGSVLNAMMLLWRFITYYLGMTVGAIIFNVWKRRD